MGRRATVIDDEQVALGGQGRISLALASVTLGKISVSSTSPLPAGLGPAKATLEKARDARCACPTASL
jgi:hypothetical protein